MGLLSSSELLLVIEKALEAGLASQSDVLTMWFAPATRASLPSSSGAYNAAASLRLDLVFLNDLIEPAAEGLLLVLWLQEASAQTALRPSTQRFFAEMAELVTTRAPAADATILAAQDPSIHTAQTIQIPEKILFRSNLLPNCFVTGASARAQSVAKLTIPRFEEGQEITTNTGKSMGVFGTGWLIGRRHLMTNWHVARARSGGEPEPDYGDVELQVENATIEFDYVEDTSQKLTIAGAKLLHGNPKLDYAIFELVDDLHREPFPLRAEKITLDPDNPFAANVIQHAGGAPRQFAIRNNLAAVVDGDDLAYFTDTAGGSSGSAVCNDAWEVVALHKASTPRFGSFSFQGKSTTWVNIGTLITAILADLRDNAAPTWAAIDATVV